MKSEQQLISKYINGEASAEDVAKLEKLLLEDESVRLEFKRQVNVVSALEDEFGGEFESPFVKGVSSSHSFSQSGVIKTAGLVAALVALTLFGVCLYMIKPKPVATLVSNEDAAWISSLPTRQGSELKPGVMELKKGVATIRFQSGAKITLEAPAKLGLKNSMRGELLYGVAIVEVPDSAHGFILDTPDVYAVDHGTAFSVKVDKSKPGYQASFEVIEGEISLHSPSGGRPVHLVEDEAASVLSGAITKVARGAEIGPVTSKGKVARISTDNRALSVIRNNNFDLLHRDYLMVKRPLETHHVSYERRSFLCFDTSGVDVKKARSANLRLNLVSCGLGHSAYLPVNNVFSVYGLKGKLAIDWQSQIRWEDLPNLESATNLGSFEIARSQKSGSVNFESKELFGFIQSADGGDVTFILTRETQEVLERGFVHSFASDSHPEASGPTLEIGY